MQRHLESRRIRLASLGVLIAAVALSSCLPPDPGGGPTTTIASSTTTTPVAASPTRISAGGYFSCAVMSDTTVRCWGRNDVGQLGDGTTTNRSSAAPVLRSPGVPLTGVAGVAAGWDFACARMFAGTVECWGSGNKGQLGNGSTSNQTAPVVVETSPGVPLAGIAQISAGGQITFGLDADNGQFACARTTVATAWCWGANGSAQLTASDPAPRTRAVPLLENATTAQGGITDLGVGARGGCATFTDNTAKCWGGVLRGDGTITGTIYPSPVLASPGVPFSSANAAVTGDNHACLRRTDFTAVCWGSLLQLGTGSAVTGLLPATVLTGPGTPLTGINRLVAGPTANCAALSGGTARCWGSGFLGDGNAFTQPLYASAVVSTATGPLTSVSDVAVGFSHGCALHGISVSCWGFNIHGSVGDGTTVDRLFAVPVVGI